MIYSLIFSLILIIGTTIWSTIRLAKQSTKDWETLKYLTQKAELIRTKEEIEEFWKEFVEKANKIDNYIIRPKLDKIEGYLKGLYKGLQK